MSDRCIRWRVLSRTWGGGGPIIACTGTTPKHENRSSIWHYIGLYNSTAVNLLTHTRFDKILLDITNVSSVMFYLGFLVRKIKPLQKFLMNYCCRVNQLDWPKMHHMFSTEDDFLMLWFFFLFPEMYILLFFLATNSFFNH